MKHGVEIRHNSAMCSADPQIIPLSMRTPDLRVDFEFVGARSRPSRSGYSPEHLLVKDRFAIGMHTYDGSDIAPTIGVITGTITFLVPYCYPHCLRRHQVISFYEGEHLIGYATIKQIINPLLETND